MGMVSGTICYHCGTANQPAENFCVNCGASLTTSQGQPALVSSTSLLKQRYRVLSKLGAGGFGAVYKVEDTQLNNRLLAAKKLDLDGIAPRDQQGAISNFQQEARILSGLTHPNIPRIYENFEDNSNHYLVMDFIEGETLYDYLDKQTSLTTPAIEVVNMGQQLAAALDYLHTRQPPIIFRDLKPENIMVTPQGDVYLIDFGIARHFKFGQTNDTVRLGTPGYVALEQLKGKSSTATDIYSLGAVLYEMLSGDVPTLPHQFAPLQFPGKPQATLAHLVMRMLENDPQQRPSSAAEVKRELQQILQALQQPSTTPNVPAKPATPASHGAPPASPAPQAQSVPKVQGELCYNYPHGSQKVNVLAWSPDGQSVAAAGEEPDQISLWRIHTPDGVSTHSMHTRRIRALAWSPTSQLLASGGNDGAVRVWQPGDSTYREYTGHTHWVQAVAWSPDGQYIASGSADAQVHLWNAATCQCRLVYREHHSDILALAFSPDSTRIASADESGAIHVWEVASGQLLTTYLRHHKAVSTLAWSPDGQQIVSGSLDWTLQVWEASSGQDVTTYAGHQRMVTAVAWSAATGRIASAGKDQSVQIWQPQTGDTLYTYRGHISKVNTLAWSPNGTYLASAGEGNTVHVWWTL